MAAALQSLYQALIAYMTLIKQQVVQVGNEYGLTAPQAFMLMMMEEHNDQIMSDFCMLLGCDPSNVTGLVDGLERKALLVRAAHPKDRRVKVLQLTPKGVAVRSAIYQHLVDENERGFTANLDAGEIEQFTVLLNKISHASQVLNSTRS